MTVAALAALAAEARADKTATAVRATRAPVIDGVLDDPVWAMAPADDSFVQEEPLENTAPTEATELRIAYDDAALYVAFRCHDDGLVVGRLTRRDRDVESDWVGIYIDSRGDRATGYGFRVSAAGVQTDLLYYNDDSYTTDWDAVWESAVRVDPDGWTAELRIPLSVLRYPSRDVQDWGLQAQRYVSHAKEIDNWSYVPRTAPAFVSYFGRLVGLRGLAPHRTLEVRPYIAARVIADSASGGQLLAISGTSPRTEGTADAGLDLKLGITPELTLDATINPDFGQVDADQVVLNLSRFETFYPEKRPFFLESLDLFQILSFQPFYSRRIGKPTSGLVAGDSFILPGGTAASTVTDAPRSLRILGAAKLTGKIAPQLQLGVISAFTDHEVVHAENPLLGGQDVEVAPRRAFHVLRTRYDFGDSSYLGLLATAVDRIAGSVWQAASDHDAYTQTLDGQWALDPARWHLYAQAALSERVGGPSYHAADGSACAGPGAGCAPLTRTDGTRQLPGDVGWGLNALLVSTGPHHIARLLYHSYSPKLDLNDVGFQQYFNEHDLRAVAGYVEKRPAGSLLSYQILTGADSVFSFDGVLKEATAFVYTDILTSGYLELQCELDAFAPSWDLNETFDGSRFERPARYGGQIDVSTDSRRAVVVTGRTTAFFDTVGAYELTGQAQVALQLLPQLELALTPETGVTRETRFYTCTTRGGAACTIDDTERDYRFATLRSSYASLTLRGSWTFSSALTLQTYGQLFLATGEHSDYRAIHTAAMQPTIRRRDLMPIAFAGDLNGDGVKDDDFQNATLNLNVVLRWEFEPGSTLMGVFTRTENAANVLLGQPPQLGVSGLTAGPTEDVFLLKLVYFLG
jgi:hypothetical protein